MKRVLILGSDFSPSSLPPATRIRFFANHLREFGWEPIILTTRPAYYEAAVDPENEKLLPDSLTVVRTAALPVGLTRKMGIGDIGMRTLWHHWRAIGRLHKEKKIDLLFIPVPPPVPMILGRLAHMRFGIPYVIDYIDPWVTDYYWSLPRNQRPPKWALSYAMSRSIEPFALRRVGHITGVSQGTTDQVLRRYPWLKEGGATEIPYGAEASDFEYLLKHPRKNPIFDPRDGKLHVCYVGAYVQTMEETLRAFFAAFRQGLERCPEVFQRAVLHFVGTTYSTNGSDPFRVTAVARDCGVSDWIQEHPQRVPYLDSLQLILDANVLVLLGSMESHYTASKVFPYVLSQRPFLAVFHEESSVIRILSEVRAGRVVSFNKTQTPSHQIEKISSELEALLSDEEKSDSICWDAFEPYTTRALTRLLAHTFDAATS